MDDYFRVVLTLLGPLPPEGYLDCRRSLRTLTDFLLTQSFGLKAFQKRNVTFGHMLVHPTVVGDILAIETSGVGILTRYTGALRHRYVECCPHFALAAYLFSRFHMPDEYGAIELKNIELNRYNIADIMLLWGNNKLQLISYSQQHKLATSALYAAGLKGVQPTLDTKPSASSVEHFDLGHLVEHAGFHLVSEYRLVRNELMPPLEVVSQIFTFVDADPVTTNGSSTYGTNDIVRAQFNQLCRHLRVLLVQDMAIIKHKYPQLPLVRHELFQLKALEDYSDQLMALNPPQYRTSTIFTSMPEMTTDVSSLQEQLRQAHEQMVQVLNDFDEFVKRLRQQYAMQIQYLNQLRNLCHGCYMLTYNVYGQNPLVLIQQNLINASHLIDTNINILLGIVDTQGVLNRMAESIRATTASLVTVDDRLSRFTDDTALNKSFGSEVDRKEDVANWCKDVVKLAPSGSVLPKLARRLAILHRRLLRQTTTLYEMWNDFKDVERGLAAHNITITEWLKVHGLLERQFRHTRQKIIKFIEDEALRRQTTVDVVKDLLHRKMMSGERPMTLDQLQRMLTSGRRIDLS